MTTFESIYKYADISVKYKTETEAFNDLMNDSVRLIIVPRNLNKEELKEFEKWEIVPKITKVAYDADCINREQRILKILPIQLQKINSLINYDVTDKKFKNIKVVFDNNNSSTIRFLKEKTGVKNLSSNCYALNSNKAVLDYISKEKNSIGIIGVNWISDHDDSTNISFSKNC
ncbi:MAG: substrate-binding domain-containing protein [Ignavibacteriales bacterium]|nr:substrate-binding domain-containing protein [Ignavibacteriales bacterium]